MLAFAGLRFHTVTLKPFLSKFRAMAVPMMPSPRNPTSIASKLVLTPNQTMRKPPKFRSSLYSAPQKFSTLTTTISVQHNMHKPPRRRRKGKSATRDFQLWNWNSLKSTGNDGEVVSEARLELASEPPDGNDFFYVRSISSSVLSILRCHGRKLSTFVTTVTALALVTPSERYLPHSSRS